MNQLKQNKSMPTMADYWRMFKKKGIMLPPYYFINSHLFDLIHNTDTSAWLPREAHNATPDNFSHGTFYTASWTNEIKRSFKVISTLTDHLSDFAFLDIGCGKGKVILVWQQLLNRIGLQQSTYGIDYYGPLAQIAMENHKKLFGTQGNFLCCDATSLDYDSFGQNLIIYLYNPFDDVILQRLLRQIKNREVFIIYNNPVHADCLNNNGYQLLYEHKGFHPNLHTMIFKRPISQSEHNPTQSL